MSDTSDRSELDEIRRLTAKLVTSHDQTQPEPWSTAAFSTPPTVDYAAMFRSITGEDLSEEDLARINTSRDSSGPDQVSTSASTAPTPIGKGAFSPPARAASASTRRTDRWVRWHRLPRSALLAGVCVMLAAVIVLIPLLANQPAVAAPAVLPFDIDLTRLANVQDRQIASSRLIDMARLAARQTPSTKEGTVQQVSSYSWSLDYTVSETATAAVSTPTFTVRRLAADDSLTLAVSEGLPFAADGQIPRASATLGPSTPLEADTMPHGFAEQLSSSPDLLGQQLLEFVGWQGDEADKVPSILFAIAQLYSTYVIEPSVEAALWQLLSAESGLHYGGKLTDRLDRTTDTFLYRDTDQRITAFMIESSTGRLVGLETMVPNPDAEKAAETPLVVSDLLVFQSRVWAK